MKSGQIKKSFKNGLMLVTSIVIMVGLVSCSSNNEKSTKTKTKTKKLKPAEQVEGERIKENNKNNYQADFGEKIDLGSGLTITISDPKIGGDDLGPWLDVSARAENSGEEDESNPTLSIICEGSPEEGGWQADSTFSLADSLPSGSFNEGRVNLLAPSDGRYGEPAPDCKTPALIRITKLSITINGNPKAIDIPLPDELIQQLNAKLMK